VTEAMRWFRWHHGTVTDPKFPLVARRAGASLPDVLAVWAHVLEQASESDERGAFGSIDTEAIDCLFNFPADETRTASILTAMEQRGLIEGGRVVRWDKRQPKRERADDSSTARVQAFRDRQRQATGASGKATPTTKDEAPGTAVEQQVTPGNTQRRGEERRGDASPDGDGKPAASVDKGRYPEEFEAAWQLYPSRPGNSKADAHKAWATRVKAGVQPAALADGVRRYAAFCEANGTEPQFIKQAATFFGPGEHFSNDWKAPATRTPAAKPSAHTGLADRNYSQGVFDDGTFV